jgi:hypothetical protein
MVSKLKRSLRQWEKISASGISDKTLIIRKCTKLKKLNFKTINDLMMKGTNELNRAFLKEEIQSAKRIHEKMLTIPNHKGQLPSRHHQQQILARMWGKRNTPTLLV